MGDAATPRAARDYQRVYKACEACRKKKIRCVLDKATGNPPGPPCVRCKRELKECVFSPERSAKKRADGGAGRSAVQQRSDALPSAPPATAHQTTAVLPSPSAPQDNGLADTVMRTIVSNGNDALKLLFRAAEHTEAQSPRYSTTASHTSPGCAPSAKSMSTEPRRLEPGVLEVWNSFRFTKMGWFTAEEAVQYVDLFYQNLAPLSPVCQHFDTTHASHYFLLTQEPLLCCTILMISSRYHILPGLGGVSKATLIHQRLWEHCQHLVMRIIFGQEKKSKAKTRTVGAIEALLLMVEWHPKAIHLPPASDGWDSALLLNAPDGRDLPPATDGYEGLGAHWNWDVVEPAKTSDRMSWMLLGVAQSLALELGICDMSSGPEPATILGVSQLARRQRIRMMLFTFAEQLSSRLGCAPLTSVNISQGLSEACGSAQDSFFMRAWIDLTSLLRTTTDVLFSSAAGIRQVIQSCRYINIIKHFQQQLLVWKDSHLRTEALHTNAYRELVIEYNHVRTLTNSLGMQAVVDRVADQTAHATTATVEMSLTPTDYEFVQEVIDGSCQILRAANDLGRIGVLRFCPVRVFMRVIAASIFLLKGLSLGSHTANLEASLATLDETIRALKESRVDDMHVASRYAELLELHVARFRQRLIASSVPRGIPAVDVDAVWGGGHVDGQLGLDAAAEMHLATDNWLSLPFDPSLAPFDLMGDTFDVNEVEDQSWDFLWNLPNV